MPSRNIEVCVAHNRALPGPSVQVEAWLNEKLQVACDENYRDPVNLPSKTKKHAAFEAEVQANRGRVEAVAEEGQRLLQGDHYAAPQIAARLESTEKLWAQLLEQTRLKKERLQDSYQVGLKLPGSASEILNVLSRRSECPPQSLETIEREARDASCTPANFLTRWAN